MTEATPYSPGSFPSDLPEDPAATYNPLATSLLVVSDPPVCGTLSDSPVAAPVDQPPPAGHELLELIACGGHGEVWRARQLSNGREVAVKRLRPPAELPGRPRDNEARFRQEAWIASNLEHPNILPVHDYGADPDGRPVMIMKLVKGRDWRGLMRDDRDALPRDEFLARHVAILASLGRAVAFAHSRGIVHRDLKPMQVMVGEFGEALLMDWGLAVTWEPRAAPDAAGVAPDMFWRTGGAPGQPLLPPQNPAGTPAYMAPEQTDRTADRLGPWTDVYLLGSILYEILVGHAPHWSPESDRRAVYRSARAGVVASPAEAAPDVETPEELAALAVHAMAVLPEDRVTSAQAFVERLNDWESGAGRRRESFRLAYRARQCLESAGPDYSALIECLSMAERALQLWPGNTAAEVLRAMVLSRHAEAALDAGDVVLARLQAERLPQGVPREALLSKVAEREVAISAARAAAERAHTRAATERDRAQRLLRLLVGDLHAALKPLGRLDALSTLCRESLDFFDALGGHDEETGIAGGALLDRTLAYLNIGDVLSDEGRRREAADAYAKARAIAIEASVRRPDDPECQLALAEAHDRAGHMAYVRGKTDDALAEHTAALSLRTGVLRRRPGDPRVEAAAATSRHRIGVTLWRRQELEMALDRHNHALSTFRGLVAAWPRDESYLAALTYALSTLANVYRDLGRLDEAVSSTREALALRDASAQRAPADKLRFDDVMWSRGNLSLLLMLRGDLEEALGLFQRDVPILRKLAMEDPTNVVRLASVSFALSVTGELQFALGLTHAAELSARDCLDVSEQLLERDPSSSQVAGSHALHLTQLGEVLAARGAWEEAAGHADAAMRHARASVDRMPTHGVFVRTLARALLLAGRACMNVNSSAASPEARRFFDDARNVIRMEAKPGDPPSTIDVKLQLALLCGDYPASAHRAMFDELEQRRWVTPYLQLLLDTYGPIGVSTDADMAVAPDPSTWWTAAASGDEKVLGLPNPV